ncbi:hypothetical protein ACIBEA_11395 [Streptomyces sp. NPDC051555]|uniref:hypothetical protein n=1 Tax=Streptomyces sp. NPDC051555 TaxID=3365657 RepID=UPI0037B0FF41
MDKPYELPGSRCQDAVLPTLRELTWDQAVGRACCSCGKQLTLGAVSRGIIRGHHGVHVTDAEVWSCPSGVSG